MVGGQVNRVRTVIEKRKKIGRLVRLVAVGHAVPLDQLPLGVLGIDRQGREKNLAESVTGQPVEQIEKDLERDNFMSADKAVEYGLIDTVLANRTEMRPAPEKNS